MPRPKQPMCARCKIKPKHAKRCYCRECGNMVASSYKRTCYLPATRANDSEACCCGVPTCNGLRCDSLRHGSAA